MTSTVNSHEGEATIALLNVATNLLAVHVGNVVGSPLFNDVPVQIGNPVLGSECGNSTISITGVLQHLISALEDGVDPLSGILIRLIDEGVTAEVPLGRLSLDVKLLSNQRAVEVVKDGTTINAGRNFLQVTRLAPLQEGSVPLSSKSLTLKSGASLVALAEDVVFVNKSSLILELVEDCLARSADIRRERCINV